MKFTYYKIGIEIRLVTWFGIKGLCVKLVKGITDRRVLFVIMIMYDSINVYCEVE